MHLVAPKCNPHFFQPADYMIHANYVFLLIRSPGIAEFILEEKGGKKAFYRNLENLITSQVLDTLPLTNYLQNAIHHS